MPPALLVDVSLVKPEAVSGSFPEKYTVLNREDLTENGQELANLFFQEKAPFTVQAQGGYYQKVLPAFVYPNPENEDAFILSWVAGVDIPLYPTEYAVSFDVLTIGQTPTKVACIKVEGKHYAFKYNDKNPIKGIGPKALKLSALPIGKYLITSIKTIQNDFGIKSLVVIDNQEYWANDQLTQIMSALRIVPPVGETRPTKRILEVLDLGTTRSGHAYVKVGLGPLLD